MTSASELSRPIKRKHITAEPVRVTASADERAQLAKRFGIEAVHALDATIALEPDGAEVRATGELEARIEQLCAVSGDPFETIVTENIDLLFVPAGAPSQTISSEEEPIEIELDIDGSDEIEYSGDSFDLGEAVAQTLGLAIDPYAEGPGAEAARETAGIESDDAPSGPMAELLKGLKDGN